jgi:hypothetical protein
MSETTKSIFDPANCAPPELPSAEDVLFQSAVGGWDNASLHYGPDVWLPYILGYKEAADRLVAQVETEHRHHDLLVFPIVYLYRHYLELAIKGLIRQAHDLLGDAVEVPATHTVVELWTTCSALLERVSPGDSLEEQRQIGRLLREFAAVDPTLTAFRYPVDKKGNLSLQGIEQINIPNVRDVIGKIALILEGAEAQMDHYADCMSDNYIYSGY